MKRTMLLAIALVSWLLCLSVAGQETQQLPIAEIVVQEAVSPPPVLGPEAVIDGPEEAKPGMLVVLDAQKSIGSGYRWLAIYGTNKLSEDFWSIDSSGTKMYFAVPVTPDASYLFVLSVAKADQSAVVHHVVKVGEPGPDPDPDPNPIPVQGLHVLVVYESEDLDDMPHGQASVFTSKPVRDYLDSHCVKVGTDPQWHFLDKDADTKDLAEDWQAVFKRAEGKELPWIIVASEKANFEGKLPENAEKVLELLKKYGGD